MKKHSFKLRILAAALSALTAAGAFSGCSQGSAASSSSDGSASEESSAQADTPVDITWYQVNRVSAVAKSMNDVRAFQEIAKATNINLTFEHPSSGSDTNEQINLLIASNALPDIIFWNWKSMPLRTSFLSKAFFRPCIVNFIPSVCFCIR